MCLAQGSQKHSASSLAQSPEPWQPRTGLCWLPRWVGLLLSKRFPRPRVGRGKA